MHRRPLFLTKMQAPPPLPPVLTVAEGNSNVFLPACSNCSLLRCCTVASCSSLLFFFLGEEMVVILPTSAYASTHWHAFVLAVRLLLPLLFDGCVWLGQHASYILFCAKAEKEGGRQCCSLCKIAANCNRRSTNERCNAAPSF